MYYTYIYLHRKVFFKTAKILFSSKKIICLHWCTSFYLRILCICCVKSNNLRWYINSEDIYKMYTNKNILFDNFEAKWKNIRLYETKNKAYPNIRNALKQKWLTFCISIYLFVISVSDFLFNLMLMFKLRYFCRLQKINRKEENIWNTIAVSLRFPCNLSIVKIFFSNRKEKFYKIFFKDIYCYYFFFLAPHGILQCMKISFK